MQQPATQKQYNPYEAERRITMGLLDLLIEELNKDEEIQKNGGVKRLHSEQYQIVQTDHGTFRNYVNSATKEE